MLRRPLWGTARKRTSRNLISGKGSFVSAWQSTRGRLNNTSRVHGGLRTLWRVEGSRNNPNTSWLSVLIKLRRLLVFPRSSLALFPAPSPPALSLLSQWCFFLLIVILHLLLFCYLDCCCPCCWFLSSSSFSSASSSFPPPAPPLSSVISTCFGVLCPQFLSRMLYWVSASVPAAVLLLFLLCLPLVQLISLRTFCLPPLRDPCKLSRPKTHSH